MKKILFCAALLAGGSLTHTYAQDFSLGLRAGVNFASFSTKGANDSDEAIKAAEDYREDRRALAGAQAGLVTNLAFSETVSLQPELLFSAKGYKREGEKETGIPGSFPVKYEDKTIMNYAELPILAKFSFGSEDVKISFLAGPYIGYLLGGRTRLEVNGQEVSKEKLNFDYKDEDDDFETKFQRLDAGAAIGASLGYNVGIGTISADIRYNYGLTDNFEYETLDNNAVEIYNRTFSVSLGWIYRFGESSLKPKPRPARPLPDETQQQTPTGGQ